MVHEVIGLNDDIRRAAKRLAAAGYAALAPDLYSTGFKPLCVARIIRDLARGGSAAVDQLNSARRWLSDRPEIDAGRIGALGFCMGGGFALALGIREDLRAVSVNYGQVPKSIEELEGVCPVVGSYGRSDKRFEPEGQRLKGFLEDLGVTHDIKFYEGIGHSFMNDSTGAISRTLRPLMGFRYEPDAAEEAWRRILGFFETHLKGTP